MPIDTYTPPSFRPERIIKSRFDILLGFSFLPRQAQDRGWKVRSPSWLHLHGQQGTLVFEVDGEGGYVPYSSHDQTAPLLVHGFAETSVGFTKTGSGQQTFKISVSMDAHVCVGNLELQGCWAADISGACAIALVWAPACWCTRGRWRAALFCNPGCSVKTTRFKTAVEMMQFEIESSMYNIYSNNIGTHT